jgi:AcrR family transcriptional regulator
MSPQLSNRQSLLEGTLRCLEQMPAERVTARAIAAESGANLASIGYHFGSKDELVTEAVILGLDRWLAEIETRLGDLATQGPPTRIELAAEAIGSTRHRHLGLARTFSGAIARSQHDPKVRRLLADGFARTRPPLAALLGLGADEPGQDAAGLIHSMFVGLLFQTLIDPELAIEGERLSRAQARLREALPAAP